MIHAYHVVMPMYGFWLPNDRRGSWSDFVRKWELVRFGKPIKTMDRTDVTQLRPEEVAARAGAKASLRYPAVSLTAGQIVTIAEAFSDHCLHNNYTLWACSILPEHTHLVIARHTFKVEQMANLLKGAATRAAIAAGVHPLAAHAKPGERPPPMWAAHQWKTYLDTERSVEEAIAYVRDNPIKEGKAEQNWSFITPFAGIPTGGWTTYH